MPHPLMFDDDDPILARVRELALAFPEASEKVSHGRPAFYTTKIFAYYGGSVKVDGTYIRHDQALMIYPDDEERIALLQDPRCFAPAYLGPYGWVAVDLDEATDWGEVRDLLDASYRLTAGPRRVKLLDTLA